MVNAERVIELAKADLGVVEQGGANRGPQIDRWLREAGARPGDPWCAAWAYSVLRRAGLTVGIPGAASCSMIVSHARRVGALVARPRRGDLVVFKWDDDPTWDHIGFVERVVTFGPVCTLQTIEGNTRLANLRSDGVYRRRRVSRRSKLAFVRL